MGLELSKTDSETDGILELWFEVKGSGCGWGRKCIFLFLHRRLSRYQGQYPLYHLGVGYPQGAQRFPILATFEYLGVRSRIPDPLLWSGY